MIKYAITHPIDILLYLYENYFLNLFLSKEEQIVRFNIKNFKGVDIEKKLLEYWKEYRHFDEIKKYAHGNMLDVGCGYTSVLHLLDGNRVGIDPTIDELKKHLPFNKDITWMNGYAESLPYDDNAFDTVFCTNGIDHYDDPQLALKEIRRVLKPTGKLILTVDIHFSHKNKQHPHSFTEEKLIKELKDWKVIYKNYAPIAGQFYRYIQNKVVNSGKEIILVCEEKK